MKSVKMINLAAHFLLELCGLAALIYWGFQSDFLRPGSGSLEQRRAANAGGAARYGRGDQLRHHG
jgi:hypothetical protein